MCEREKETESGREDTIQLFLIAATYLCHWTPHVSTPAVNFSNKKVILVIKTVYGILLKQEIQVRYNTQFLLFNNILVAKLHFLSSLVL